MSERLPYDDVALFVNGDCSLSTFSEIISALSDAEIEVDFTELEFDFNGTYFDASYPHGMSIEDEIKKIHNDLGFIEIDWDTMAEWDPVEEYDEQC